MSGVDFFFNLDLYPFQSIIRHASLFFRSYSGNLPAMLMFLECYYSKCMFHQNLRGLHDLDVNFGTFGDAPLCFESNLRDLKLISSLSTDTLI